MGVSRATGYPVYGASGAGFVPEVWAGLGITKFYKYTVLAAIASTDYQGEIANHGDKVIIRTTPTITISDYVVGGGLTYEKPYSPPVELLIDKAKSFSFELNDIDKAQSDRKLVEEWSEDAGQQMKIAIDAQVLGAIYADVSADNTGATAGAISGGINLGVTGTPVAISTSTVVNDIINVGQAMDEQNIPEMGRWMVIPAWMGARIKGSDLKDASLAGDATSIMRNGRVGMIDRFELFQSNQLTSVTDGANTVTHILAGHKAGLTFASQLTNMETLMNQNDFGRLVRGLNVYGYKVIEPKYLFDLYGYPA